MSRQLQIAMDHRLTHCATAIRLPGGRLVSYAETGPPDGLPVLYCHGAIGTPLRYSVDLEAIAARLGIRHIAVNRPGIGGSDRVASPRTVLEFAGDVEALTEALGVERFMVIGVSAGGPYALAAAHALGDRVLRVAVCSSLSPLCAPHRTPGMPARIGLALSALAAWPRACVTVGDLLLPVIRRHPGLLHRVIAAHAAPSERDRLADPAERLAAGSSFLDATAYGVGGMVDDYVTYSRPWGFRPADVDAEVHVWHGANDPLVPVEHALQLAVELPHCRVFVDPEEGHHFFRRRLGEILETLLGHAGSSEPARGAVAVRAGEQ
jgi:pimeloyl-ACP methyl ester carboxylesterase